MESAMNLSRLVLTTSLGLGLFSTGCLGAKDTLPDDDLQPPDLTPLTGNVGGIGPNGLEAELFHANKNLLRTATQLQLVGNDSQVHQGVLDTGLLDSVGGLKTFKYAVQCALPDEVTVFASAKPYPGGGLLGTTGSWQLTPLGPAAQKDLFACMIAHLNPSGEEVMIQLTGKAIPVEPGDQSAFSFEEAVWITKIGTSSALEFHVWPLSDLESSCGHDVGGSLQTRVCGEGIVDCGLQVRGDYLSACTILASGDHMCDGQRAIKTRLMPQDVSRLHGECGL
jgi:hypothetical protein